MELSWKVVTRTHKAPHVDAQQRRTVRSSLCLFAHQGEALGALGEASPLAGRSKEAPEECEAWVVKHKTKVETLLRTEQSWTDKAQQLSLWVPTRLRSLRFALETLMIDAEARRKGVPALQSALRR